VRQSVYRVGFAAGIQVSQDLSNGKAAPEFLHKRTNGQVYDIVAKYIRDHPETRDHSFGILMIQALLASVETN
jgi:hypothetical protein